MKWEHGALCCSALPFQGCDLCRRAQTGIVSIPFEDTRLPGTLSLVSWGTTGLGIEDKVLVPNSPGMVRSAWQGEVGLATELYRCTPPGGPWEAGVQQTVPPHGRQALILEAARSGFEYELSHSPLATHLAFLSLSFLTGETGDMVSLS